MKKFFSLINNVSIKTKIAFGFIIYCSFFIILNFNFFMLLERVEDKVDSLDNYTVITSDTIQINQELSDIQRLVLAYGQTGSSAIYNKLKSNYELMNSLLDDLLARIDDPRLLEELNILKGICKRYGTNINNLQHLYEAKDQLTNKNLDDLFIEGQEQINSLIKIKSLRKDIRGQWYEAKYYADQFFSRKIYKSKKEVFLSLDNIDTRLSKENGADQFLRTTRKFRDNFEKGVLANRNYSSLVNVVMSGDASEFTVVANKLKVDLLNVLDNKKRVGKLEVNTAKTVTVIGFILIIPLCLLLLYFYNRNISSALSRITHTFENFIANNFDADVPGLKRNDEIGVLAKAANNFKEMSKEFQEEKRKAEELAKIKADFLANMSHEIRTPMNGILGMVTHLSETSLKKEQSDMLKTISSCGLSLMAILNDILDISKADAGKLSLDYGPIDLRDLTEEINFLFNENAKEKGIDFICLLEVEKESSLIKGDVTRLKQIIINLVSNAIKFTEEGCVTFKIKAKDTNENVPKENFVTLEYSVEDTGIGIPEDKVKDIFSSFTQSDTSITRRFGGTGLGLAISQKLASLMGSEIRLTTNLGIGSKFTFDLKSEVLKESEKLNINELESEELLSPLCGHCLVVEDNDINIKVLTKRLEKWGLTFQVAYNGKEAIDVVSTRSFDFILMDIQMPVLDGISATKELRRRGMTIPIVAMTANVQNEDREECLKVGMNFFLGKPFRKRELYDVLQACLEKNVS